MLDSNLLVTVGCCCTPCAPEQTVPYSRVPKLEKAQWGAWKCPVIHYCPLRTEGGWDLSLGNQDGLWLIALPLGSSTVVSRACFTIWEAGVQNPSYLQRLMHSLELFALSGTISMQARSRPWWTLSHQGCWPQKVTLHPFLHIAHPQKQFLVLAEFTHLLTL